MKHFSVDEANEALRRVRPLAEEIVAQRRELARLQGELEGVEHAVAGNGGGLDVRRARALQRAVSDASRRLSECIDEIHELGAQVKDLDQGLVDFPARHPEDGRTVLLCWHVGEEELAHWHGLEEGFAGRKPLPF
jgi:hypothetical protein